MRAALSEDAGRMRPAGRQLPIPDLRRGTPATPPYAWSNLPTCALQVRTFSVLFTVLFLGYFRALFAPCLGLIRGPRNNAENTPFYRKFAYNMSPIIFAVVGYMHAQKEGVELDCPSQVFRKVLNQSQLSGVGRRGARGRRSAVIRVRLRYRSH